MVFNNIAVNEFKIDSQSGALNQGTSIFNATQSVIGQGSYVEDYFLIRATSSDTSVLGYGILKLGNNTIATYGLLPLANDNTQYLLRIYSWRHIPTLKSILFDNINNYIIWGNGTHIMNTTVLVTRSPSTQQIMYVDFQD